MDKIIVEGGQRLEGHVTISGAKNAALPMLFAALLTDGVSCFTNVPYLKDIESALLLLGELGARVERDQDRVSIDTSQIASWEAPYDLVRKMRASILVLGPLVARFSRARVSMPGGCAIGARPINLHLKGLAQLGAEIDLDHGYVEAIAPNGLVGKEIFFDVVTVTGTENLMMAAALAKGTTVLRNSAREPEITALAELLIRMGARIEGIGTSIMTIHGVDRLQAVETRVIPDRIEAGTYMVAAAITGGDVTLSGCQPDHMGAVLHKLKRSGAEVAVDGNQIRVVGTDQIIPVDLETLPFPGFPTDMQAQFMVMLSIAQGTSMICETIFENRFIHISELKRMGADIKVSGNTALVRGVQKLSAAPVMASDLRASASLILAGLVAEGCTEVNRVYHLDRGYETLEKKMQCLGARIQRVPA